MDVLVITLIVIAAIIASILIVAMFTKQEYSVQREIIIDKPRQEVFNYIKYLRNQDNFSKWAMTDPNMKKESRGTDGTVGFVSAWENTNKKAGKGEQEIKKIKDGEKISTEITFNQPLPGKATSHITTDTISGDRTKVKWLYTSRTNFPVNIMLIFMKMEELIGNDLETGLKNLKMLLEKKKAVSEPEQMEQVGQ